MNSRELSKSDHEEMSESLRGHHEQGQVIGDVNRRFSKEKMADGRTFRKASLAVRTNVVTEVRNDIANSPKSAAMSCRLKAENSNLDYSVGCCVISSVKSPKMAAKPTTESHRKATNRSSLRCADRRRGSDPGLNMQVKCLNSEVSPNLCLPPQSVWTGESTRSCARSRKGACDYVNLREMFLANGVMTTPDMESCRSATSHPYDQCQTADSRRHWLSFNDRRSNPGPDLCSSPSAVPNRRLQGSQSSLRHDPQECCVDSHALRRSFRKSRNSSRKEWSVSRDAVSEFGIESSAPLSPLLKRRSSRRKTSTKSREIQQTTTAKDSGEVLITTEKNQVLETSRKSKPGTDTAGCHATTQTEWHNGWEPVPSGCIPVFRARIQTLPQNSNPLTSSKDVRDSGCSTPEHQILNDIPLPAMRYAQELPMGKPPLFDLPPDTSSRLSSERSSATGWGSMDNLGFLSSGDSSDQTRATASASSSKPRPRAKDDWALYRSPRSEENQHAALPRYQSDTSLDREMAQLSQEMASIQMECEVLVSRHINERLKGVGNQGTSANVPTFLFPQSCSSHHQPSNDEGPSHPSFIDQTAHMILNQNKPAAEMQSEASSVNEWINNSAYKHLERLESEKSSSDHEIEEESKDSSSAYNTGESSGSTAMGQAGSNTSGEFQKSLMTLISDKMAKENPDDHDQQPEEDSCNYCEQLKEASCQCSEEGKNLDSGDVKVITDPNIGVSEDPDDVFHPSFSPGTIMYTNEAHLQHTIFLQQQLLRRALTMSGSGDLECQSSISFHKELVSSHCFSGQEEDSSTSKTPETEWRVKRRPDGTRYITRRPSRTKILKERALRITEERRGLTTDEDATSEMKLGRYWSREERKRHLERARERRKKEGNIGRSKLAVVKEGRLSLVVVQEEETLVSPGSKKSNSSGKYLPLYPALTKVNHYTKLARTSAILSVTTV